jgi:hypothetical protein
MRTSKSLTSALLGSVALSAMVGGAVAADERPVFALTGAAGVIGIGLPTFDTGAFGHTADGLLFGGMIGGSITTGIGDVGGYDAFVSLRGFGSFAMSADQTFVDTFDGADGIIVITGLTAPGGLSAITMDPTVSTVDVTGANGANDVVTSTAGGAVGNANGVTPDTPPGLGFIIASATDDGAGGNSSGFAGIGDTTGGIFIASGDFEDLEVTTTVSRHVLYGGADLTLGLAGELSGGTSLQVYAGPSYRGLKQTNTTTISINIPEEEPSEIIHAEFAIEHEDLLSTHYLGGIVGGALVVPTDSGVVFSLGLEGGVYNAFASWTGTDTYSTCCGSDDQGDPSPNLSVTADPLSFDFDNQIAFAARGNASASFAVDTNKVVTLGAGVEYLSHVAQVNHSGLTQTDAASDDYVAGDPIPAASTFSWGHMFNVMGTISLTGTF